ncbi:hypothetical protein [Culicoidibacter larvae]|uniref:Uncharacterized protein n=1 Tax=Culicoidibacter larvae TaxID=2579976 RepID=A0A5R8QCY4_9FIRM|nr:hypothetical protein [Culicoidibacter larvae]TLG72962.1 hypothetical protein FEZ08_07910 [Culicoidibacter larvae]
MMKRLLLSSVVFLAWIGMLAMPVQASQPLTKEPISQEELQYVEEAGTYAVRLQIRDGNVTEERIIYVTVTFPRTIVSEVYQEAIDAYDFELTNADIGELSEVQLIALARAHAWSTYDGHEIAIASVRTSNSASGYLVSFATELGTSITVNARVVPEVIFDDAKSYYSSGFGVLQEYTFVVVTVLIILFLVVPLVLITILYFRSQRLYKETEKLLYEE